MEGTKMEMITISNMKQDAYIVKWKEKGELVSDYVPRSEFEALRFAVKKNAEHGGSAYAFIYKTGTAMPKKVIMNDIVEVK